MTVIDFHQLKFLLKSLFNYTIILLVQIFCMRSLTILVLSFLVMSFSFFARLNVCHRQKIKLEFQKISVANKIIFTMYTGIWSRSSSCHGLSVFTAKGQRHFAKLRLTFYLARLLADAQESRLKVLSNRRFLLIPLDEKKERDGRLNKRGVKVGAASSKNVFLIVLLYWPTLCLFRTGVDVYKEDHVEKSGGYSINTVAKDGEAKNPGTSISIANANGGVDGLSTSIRTANADGRANN